MSEEEVTPEADSQTAEDDNNENATEDGERPQGVPYERFREVNSRWQATREELEAMRTELEELKAEREAKGRETERDPDDLPMAPAGLNQRQALEWYIREGVKRFVGMDADSFRTSLKAIPEASRSSQRVRWESMCAKHGLDPDDKQTQRLATGLLQAGLSEAEAMKNLAALVKPQSQARKDPPPNMETGGMSRHMTKDDLWVDNPLDAVEHAKKGKLMPHLSVEQIFAKRKANRRG